MINAAINNAMAARRDWEAKPISDRAQIFLKAADILADEKRADVLATTMAGQVFYLRMLIMYQILLLVLV